ILEAAAARSIAPAAVSDFTVVPGRGVTGSVDGGRVLLGNAALLEQEGVDLGLLEASAERFAREGRAIRYVAVARAASRIRGRAGEARGLVGIADPVKPTAQEAIRLLRAEGLRVLMVTGDGQETAETVARQVGIDELRAGLLPAEKSAVVDRLTRERRIVAM